MAQEYDPDQYEEITPPASPSAATPKVEPMFHAPSEEQKKLVARRIGLIGRAGANVLTGTLGAIGDFGAGVEGLVTGKYKPSRIGSQAIRETLNQYYPEPQGFEENAVDTALQMGLGRFDVLGNAVASTAGKLAPNAPQAFVSAKDQLKETVSKLHKEGIKLLPGEGKGGSVGRFIAGVGDEDRIAQRLQFDNQEVFDRLARKEAGVNPQLPLTTETLNDRIKTLGEIGYAPLQKVPYVKIDNTLRKELSNIYADIGSSRSFPRADKEEVLKEVLKYGKDERGKMLLSYTGSDVVKAIRNLRKEADELYGVQGQEALAQAKRRIATALEDNTDRFLSKTGRPGLVESFRENRAAMARAFAVKKILSDQVTGSVDPVKAQKLQAGGEKLTGGLETIAAAGSKRFSKSTQAPTKEPETFKPWEWSVLGAGLVSGGFHPGGVVFGPMAAGGIASRPYMRKLIESKPMQNFMFNQRPQMLDPQTRLMMELQAGRMVPSLFSQGEE